jgi:hypothetical protein
MYYISKTTEALNELEKNNFSDEALGQFFGFPADAISGYPYQKKDNDAQVRILLELISTTQLGLSQIFLHNAAGYAHETTTEATKKALQHGWVRYRYAIQLDKLLRPAASFVHIWLASNSTDNGLKNIL